MKRLYEEIKDVILNLPDDKILEELKKYHTKDIAEVVEALTEHQRKKVYNLLGIEKTAEIMEFYDNVEEYIEELSLKETANILEQMDTSLALEILNELDSKEKTEIINLFDNEVKESIQKLDSYDKSFIGSYMSDNYILIKDSDSISQAMTSMISQAGEKDNIFTLFVVDKDNKYVGAIYLKDLIVSRKEDELSKLIKTSYPSFYDKDIMEECMNKIREYEENLIPVLTYNMEIVGVITTDTILDMVEKELEDDYAKLGGLSKSEGLDESIVQSIKKRVPWLFILLFLGFIVSSVIGIFENVIAILPVIVFFQSMILDMAGNVGTQSLAVTIRNITEEDFKKDKDKQKKSILKELKIGFLNGIFIGMIALIFVLLYLAITQKEIYVGAGYVFKDTFIVALIIGFSMLCAITLSSLIGTLFPLILIKLKIDPAVASGPFITTLNDIIAIIVYYGLTYWFFIAS